MKVLADSREVAHILHREWGPGLGQFRQRLTHALRAFDASFAGNHSRAHRSTSARSKTHLERSGGHRVALQPGPAIQLGVEPAVDDLAAAQFIDQVKFTRQPEYVFHHPLIRAVAYEAQLKSDRADVHRRLASAIEERDHDSVGENAALIAEHLEAASDLRAAYAWHMRVGAWSSGRDIRAARISWERARRVADALPANDPERTAMRIAPRTVLCTTTWRVGLGVADTGFDELRELCSSAGDDVSLAIGMYGQVAALIFEHRHLEASVLASEQFRLLQKSPDARRTCPRR